MTVEALVRLVQTEGIDLSLSGAGAIKAVGERAAVDRWLPTLVERKPEIIVWLRERKAEGDEYTREWFEERAAIMEFDGNLTREEAERRAVEALSPALA